MCTHTHIYTHAHMHTVSHHTCQHRYNLHTAAKFRCGSQVDSGVANDVGSPDMTDIRGIEQENSPPPWIFPPYAAPPLLRGGASVNFIPDTGDVHLVGSEGLDVDSGSCKTMRLESDDGEASTHTEELVGHKRSTSTLAVPEDPVLDSSESINTTSHQQETRPVDATFQSNVEESLCVATVGSSIEPDTEDNEENGQPDPQPSLSPVPKPEVTRQSQSEKGQAMVCQSVHVSHRYVLMDQFEEVRKDIKTFQQQQMEALQKERQHLSDEFACYQRRQLEECQLLLSMEKNEKYLAMLECNARQRVIKIKQDEINSLMMENSTLKVSLAETKAKKVNLQKDLRIAKAQMKWYEVVPYLLICVLVLYIMYTQYKPHLIHDL